MCFTGILLVMESRNLSVMAARLCRHLITIIIIITVSSAGNLITYGVTQPRDLSQQHFIVCRITQPRSHTPANQTVQIALQHIRTLGYE